MDPVALDILQAELAADCKVAAESANKARLRAEENHPGHLEAAAFELARFYNVIERMLERICETFENHFEKRGDFHERLLQRLALELPGIRPAFLPADALADLRELKGFRHLIRHAYDLTLIPERVLVVIDSSERINASLPKWCEEFIRNVRLEQGW